MMSKTFFRYAAVLSLFACAACAPQEVPIGDDIKADVASQVAPVAADAVQAAVAGVKPAHSSGAIDTSHSSVAPITIMWVRTNSPRPLRT